MKTPDRRNRLRRTRPAGRAPAPGRSRGVRAPAAGRTVRPGPKPRAPRGSPGCSTLPRHSQFFLLKNASMVTATVIITPHRTKVGSPVFEKPCHVKPPSCTSRHIVPCAKRPASTGGPFPDVPETPTWPTNTTATPACRLKRRPSPSTRTPRSRRARRDRLAVVFRDRPQ
jgi:hypothetical protein